MVDQLGRLVMEIFPLRLMQVLVRQKKAFGQKSQLMTLHCPTNKKIIRTMFHLT